MTLQNNTNLSLHQSGGAKQKKVKGISCKSKDVVKRGRQKTKFGHTLAFFVILSVLFLVPTVSASNGTVPDTGIADNFVIISDAAFTIGVNANVTGDIGAASATTPAEHDGIIQIPANASVKAARDAVSTEMDTYSNLIGNCDFYDGAAVDLAMINSRGAGVGVYTPGVYCITGAITQTNNITLNGPGAYIFKFGAAYSNSANVMMNLINGASSRDIFFKIVGAPSFAVGVNMSGTYVSGGAISSVGGVTINGRIWGFGAPGTIALTTTNTLIVPPISVPPLIFLNSTGFNVTYPTSTNVTGSGCPAELTCNLYRDGVLVAGGSEVGILATGTYNYVYNTTGNANYSAATINNNLTVSQGTLNASITNDTALTRMYDENTTTINISELNIGDGDVIYKLYVNGVDEGSSYTQSAIGTYVIILNSTGGTNYSSSSSLDSENLTINQASPPLIFLNSTGFNVTYLTTRGFDK